MPTLYVIEPLLIYGFSPDIERVFMVQTEQQYVCIHQCLLAVLEGKEHLLADSHELHENDGYEGK